MIRRKRHLLALAALTIPALAGQSYSCAQIRGGLYWITDGAYNTMFLVTRDGVIAVDAPPTLGENYLKAIRQVTSQPVKYLIYSHEHTDHIGAASLFPKSAQIVAQEETAAILKRRSDPRRPLPTITFRDRYTLKTGGEELQLIYPGPNHQTGNILIWAPRQKTLMLVDVIYPGYMPYKNLGIVEDVPGYIAVHRTVLGFGFDTFVGGHVGKLGTRADVEASLQFTTQLYSTASRELTDLPFPAYLKLHPGPDAWNLHNDYEKTLVDRCAAQLQAIWEKRFTDAATYLKDNCWAMIEAIIVQTPPSLPGKPENR